jgi:aldose 1-epimerase
MYAAMLGRRFSRLRAKAWQAAVLRSGMVTVILLVLLMGGLILFVKERGKGHLHNLETQLQSKQPVATPVVPPPGGQDAIVMRRSPAAGGAMSEFLTVTLLPGRGMNVLQITAMLPGSASTQGEVALLTSPGLEEASKILSGVGDDKDGRKSLGLGGAFEIPWAGRLGGVPTPDGGSVMSVWQGQTLILPSSPRDSGAAGMSLGGLMLKRAADKIETHVVPDGWQSRAVYNAGGFDGHWLSQTEVSTAILLNGRVIELAVVAKNIGSVAEPIGIGWRPHFSIPSGDRANALLRVPESMREEIRLSGTGTGLPTGKMMPVVEVGAEFDPTKQTGAKLGTHEVSETFGHLRTRLMDTGPAVELRDVTGKVGIRITALSPTIKAFRVEAPADKASVMISPQFNLDDPFGKEWAKDEDTGMMILQPGQSAQWKVRVELFPLALQAGQHY